MRTPLKVSPAPTVSATTTGTPGTSRVVPSGRTATAPSPPRVTTTSPGPAAAHRVAVATGSASGCSQWRSSSLTLTTSERVTSSSTRRTGSVRSGVMLGRALGSREMRARPRWARNASRTVSAPGSSTVAMEPAWSTSQPSSGTSSRCQSRSKTYDAAPLSSRVTTALDVRPLAVVRARTVTSLASSHARTAAPRSSSPSRVTSRTSRPSRPSVIATLAGLPPGKSCGRPALSGTTSTSASPTTRTRGCASVMPPSCRWPDLVRQGRCAGETRVGPRTHETPARGRGSGDWSEDPSSGR